MSRLPHLLLQPKISKFKTLTGRLIVTDTSGPVLQVLVVTVQAGKIVYSVSVFKDSALSFLYLAVSEEYTH